MPARYRSAQTFQYHRSRGLPEPTFVADFKRAHTAMEQACLGGHWRPGFLCELMQLRARPPEIEPGLIVDVGSNLRVGDDVRIGRKVVLLDMGPITLGHGVVLGDGVHIYNASHDIGSRQRWTRCRFSEVHIGDGAILGNGCVVLPGAQIPAETRVPPFAVVGPKKTEQGDVRSSVLARGHWAWGEGADGWAWQNNTDNVARPPHRALAAASIEGGERGYGLINAYGSFDARAGIQLGESVLMGPGVRLLSRLSPEEGSALGHEVRPEGTITVGDNVWLSGRTTLLPGVSIGAHSVVLGYNQYVDFDVPPGSLVDFVGGTARVRAIDFGEAE